MVAGAMQHFHIGAALCSEHDMQLSRVHATVGPCCGGSWSYRHCLGVRSAGALVTGVGTAVGFDRGQGGQHLWEGQLVGVVVEGVLDVRCHLVQRDVRGHHHECHDHSREHAVDERGNGKGNEHGEDEEGNVDGLHPRERHRRVCQLPAQHSTAWWGGALDISPHVIVMGPGRGTNAQREVGRLRSENENQQCRVERVEKVRSHSCHRAVCGTSGLARTDICGRSLSVSHAGHVRIAVRQAELEKHHQAQHSSKKQAL